MRCPICHKAHLVPSESCMDSSIRRIAREELDRALNRQLKPLMFEALREYYGELTDEQVDALEESIFDPFGDS